MKPERTIHDRYRTLDPLPKEEEYALIRRWQRNQDRAALDRLVRANMRFVVRVAKEYARPEDEDFGEIVAVGGTGLQEAASRFKLTKGYKFISYAVWWIRQAILKHRTDMTRTVRIPVNASDALYRAAREQERLQQADGRAVALHTVAEGMEDAQNYADIAFQWASGGACIALDEDIEDLRGRRPLNVHDHIADPSATNPLDQAVAGDRARHLRRALDILDPRSRKIVERYHGLDGEAPETLEQIGQMLGITRERTRQIKKKATERLRHRLRHREAELTLAD